jgi:Transposase DDE domain
MKVHGLATWKPRMLAAAALFWAISEQANLTERFELSRKIVNKVFRWQPSPGTSYQGFMKMLRKWHVELMLAIVPDVRAKMKEVLPGQWEIAGYVVFAGDGSRIELARTESLEEAFSPKRARKQNGKRKKGKRGRRGRAHACAKRRRAKKQSDASVNKKANSPQMWLTLLWHVGSGLPWAWRSGPSDSSERGHLQEMLAELPENSLITADAGFIGYDFWTSILEGGHNFVIRVGGNVSLLRKLGYAREYDHVVYLWPDQAAKKKQPPLVLRLIVIHNGRHPVYLVTNLTKTQLSDQQAATIYGVRWGIELFFRTFKQTFGRRKLRSHKAENAKLELDWSLLGLWCVCLLGQRELAESGQTPSRLSPAAAIRAVQRTLRDYRLRPESCDENLWSQLRIALLDDYDRSSSKTSRNYPRKKKRERIGNPKITNATKQQINQAKELTTQPQQFRLPA